VDRQLAPALRAVIFDVDGTLADTERDGHRHAFNAAFVRHGVEVEWSAEEYGRLLEITGGRRRIAADLSARGFGESADGIAARVHRTKTDLFRALVVNGRLAPRPGMRALIADLVGESVRIAVATTGRRSWVDPLIARLLRGFPVDLVVTGDDVTDLKPDPEAYLKALDGLGLAPHEALAVEDSANGLQAATAAGLPTVVVTNGYTREQDFTGAAAVRPAYDAPHQLLTAECRELQRQWWAARADAAVPGPGA
jgi:HAD superfamily hydrolase (TIGR01509 family)